VSASGDIAGAMDVAADRVTVMVRLTPKASRDGVDGVITLSDGRSALAMRVRAVPEKGAANAALTKTLAKALGVGKTQVEVVAGTTARLKKVMIRGDGPALAKLLAAIGGDMT